MKKNWLLPVLTICMISLVILSFTVKKNYTSASTNSFTKTINTIVIDAGHGFRCENGCRHGSTGENITEDQVSYEVSKRIVAELKKKYPSVKIIESRPTPFFVENRARAEFANKNKGDLFVSIHCNFVPKIRDVRREGTRTETKYVYVGKGKKRKKVKKTITVPVYKTYYLPNPAHGTETYVFAAHKTDDKEEIIMENGDIFENEKDDSTINNNINDPLIKQQVALWTKQFFANSVKLASMMEEEFTTLGRFSRGVKQRQKGIWVLQATAMPSILIELGFLSNSEEEAYLLSEPGQQQMAESIVKAISRYKELVEKGAPQPPVNNGKR
ncbi:MAG: N-acetylmuramoyl-L-alanine amidase [Chitinophagaceae bacterium]|nr:N-acetylmuramoyl-L-alanine amidase [Chitinophagaceae bacterium]